MPLSPNRCGLLGAVSLHTVLTAAGRQDQLLATEPGGDQPWDIWVTRTGSPERDRDRPLTGQPMQRGALGREGPGGPATRHPHPSTSRTGQPRHFTAQRGHRRSAPRSRFTRRRVQRQDFQRQIGNGDWLQQAPTAFPRNPRTQGSVVSPSSLPWAAGTQPRCSPSVHLEITDPHFQLLFQRTISLYVAFGLTLRFFLPFISRSLQSIL